ncbi:hypothetical protein D3C78_1140080 [compost metagenome]
MGFSQPTKNRPSAPIWPLACTSLNKTLPSTRLKPSSTKLDGASITAFGTSSTMSMVKLPAWVLPLASVTRKVKVSALFSVWAPLLASGDVSYGWVSV